MPRVLVQLNSLALGGTQINAVDFAAAVAAHGYESVLVGPADTLPRGPSLFDIAKERAVELETLDRPRSTVAGAIAMARLAKERHADLVHVYGSWTSRPAWWGPCLFGRRPLVLTVYEMAVDPMTPRHTELIVGTKYLEEEFAWRAGTTLISPPVDTSRDDPRAVSGDSFIDRLGLNPGNLRVVMVTRLDEDMKAAAVQAAIQAVGANANPGVDLVIVGTGDAESPASGARRESQRGPAPTRGGAGWSTGRSPFRVRSGGRARRDGRFCGAKPGLRKAPHSCRRSGLVPDVHAGQLGRTLPQQLLEPGVHAGSGRRAAENTAPSADRRSAAGGAGALRPGLRGAELRAPGNGPAPRRHIRPGAKEHRRSVSWARDLPLEIEHLRRRLRRNPGSTTHRGAVQVQSAGGWGGQSRDGENIVRIGLLYPVRNPLDPAELVRHPLWAFPRAGQPGRCGCSVGGGHPARTPRNGGSPVPSNRAPRRSDGQDAGAEPFAHPGPGQAAEPGSPA